MIGTLVAVFALGLRHGADPDHIAAIDNLTRNAFERRPFFSRFVGTLFAGGHTVMVLAIAALVGFLGSKFAPHHDLIETIGTWISIVVLVAIAILNVRQLRERRDGPLAGVRMRFMPRALREATSPWLALPVGFLFGFGFETSSQIATYTLAFGAQGGVAGALLVGATFCLGMILTDTLDSVLVHRLVSDRSGRLPATMRVWIWSVTLVALAIAAYELFTQILGWKSPVPDLTVSGIIVAALLGVFAYVLIRTRRMEASGATPHPDTIS